MGSRGFGKLISRVPNYKNATVINAKLKNYLLNPDKDNNGKTAYFNSLGYNFSNFERLKNDLLEGLRTNKALQYKEDEYGNVHFEVLMNIGIERKDIVKTAWIMKKGNNYAEFTTAHKFRGKKKEKK